MMWYNISWSRLRYDSPIDISTVTELAGEIDDVLMFINPESDDIEYLRLRLRSLRGKLITLILTFLSVIRKNIDEYYKEQPSKGKFINIKVESDLNSILEDLKKTEKTTVATSRDRSIIVDYISTIETILYGVIYYSIEEAIKLEKDPHKFIAALWSCIERKSGVIGKIEFKKEGTASLDYNDFLKSSEVEKSLKDKFEKIEKASELKKEIGV